MLSFASDYTEGACEEILQKLAETNRESLPGYGMDRYCQSAARKIQEATGCPEAEVYFLVGGTQTNAVVISSMLAPYEGVVAAQTGHVSIHEAGAIEYTGHKVLQLPEKDGKIDPADLQEYLQNFEADANNDIWYFREWCIFPIRRNTEPYTAGRSCRRSRRSAVRMKSRSIWTERVLDMVWRERKMT